MPERARNLRKGDGSPRRIATRPRRHVDCRHPQINESPGASVELGHAGLERRRFHTEPDGRAFRSTDAPRRGLEDGEDVIALDVDSLGLRDVAADVDSGSGIVSRLPVATIIARSTTLRSSRMLPGQE